MKEFILVLSAIILFNSCGGTEIAEETNPYKGVKTKKVSHYNFLKEKFGDNRGFIQPLCDLNMKSASLIYTKSNQTMLF